jgi:hypothetical protein
VRLALDREAVRRACSDVGVFARALVGAPLWPHQLVLARSPARYRVIAAGRQSGKSRALAVIALHEAFRRPGRLVLIVSAGEVAARRLLEECSSLALASPLLADSVLDDSSTVLTLANGSVVRSVPASQRQIRGWAVDLLLVDEAGFIDPEIWRAAEPAIIARPGSRVILSSSPWGGPEHFFRQLWHRGMRAPDGQVAAWHWPSSISPLVDEALLDEIRGRESPSYFAREYLAEWTDGAGSYFTTDEIDSNVADFELIDPTRADGQAVVGGVDFGFAQDANTLVLLGVLADGGLNEARHPTEPVFFVPWLEEHFRMRYAAFIDRVVDVADRDAGGFWVRRLASETNAVGAMPTETLRTRAWERGTGMGVFPVHTDNRRKESAFGAIKGLLQEGRLVLPRHPALLRQLAGLEFEITDAGNTKISVPERVGHDDLAMALAQAVSCIRPSIGYRPEWDRDGPSPNAEILLTAGGTAVPRRPRCADLGWRAFSGPVGAETGHGW